MLGRGLGDEGIPKAAFHCHLKQRRHRMEMSSIMELTSSILTLRLRVSRLFGHGWTRIFFFSNLTRSRNFLQYNTRYITWQGLKYQISSPPTHSKVWRSHTLQWSCTYVSSGTLSALLRITLPLPSWVRQLEDICVLPDHVSKNNWKA